MSVEERLPEAGYCLEGCGLSFDTEHEANTHYALTGHMIGWPFEGPASPDPEEQQ